MILGLAIEHGASWWVGCLVCIGFGLLLGLVNGLGVGILKIRSSSSRSGRSRSTRACPADDERRDDLALPVPALQRGGDDRQRQRGPFPTILLIGIGMY
jgi:hypothetical protein